jgi:hypothetical protein
MERTHLQQGHGTLMGLTFGHHTRIPLEFRYWKVGKEERHELTSALRTIVHIHC